MPTAFWRMFGQLAMIAALIFWAQCAQAQVVILVNGEPITAYDIEQRTKLLQTSTRKPPARQEVVDELINDRLKLQIAKRYELEITDSMLDNTFAGIARNARTTPENFAKILTATGIDVKSFKHHLRADLAWAQIIRGKFQNSLQIGERDVFAALESRKQGEDIGYEYRLTPITFVVPRGAAESTFEARKREAETLRQRFQNCDEGVRFARALRDVAVREPIVRSSADLAPALRQVLDSIEIGRLTTPEITQNGVELFALCSRKQITADTPGKREVRDEIFSQKFQAQSRRYLNELRSAAMIEYR